MSKLENKITLTEDIITSPNLTGYFTQRDLETIGDLCNEAYQEDIQSRAKWLKRNKAAMNLAMQVQEEKNFPWPNCSNVIFPLITIAALQFHSRAYPALISGSELVKCKFYGTDPDGTRQDAADKISQHMSWQLLEEDESWEEQQDRALINVPIVGCAFKKTYYDGVQGKNISELVLAKDLVFNYWSKSVETAPVKTHRIPFSKNTIYTRIMTGTFRDVSDMDWYKDDAPVPQPTADSTAQDKREGLDPPSHSDSSTPYVICEQHRYLDLDQDGYAEPYIVTFEESTHTVLRIVCRFDREEDILRDQNDSVIKIDADEYYTKIPFIPSPDGGVLDIGFGVLLGPLTESVDTAINQIFDSGTLYNTSGGFLGRGAKLRGGVYHVAPYSWHRVDSSGDDLRKSMIPFPTKEPSGVLFQVLTMLIDYIERISGAVEITTGGNPGQNTPATTSQSMIEQGQKVYSAIFKRIWRSMKMEFKKLFILNAKHLGPGKTFYGGTEDFVTNDLYKMTGMNIIPVADPNIMSDQARLAQAQLLMQVGKDNPLYNQDEINKRFLRAIKITDIDKVYVGTKNQPPSQPSEKIQIEMIKGQIRTNELTLKKLQYISSLLEQRRLNEAKIVEIYAQAKLFEEQAGGSATDQELAKFKTLIDSIQSVNDMINQNIQQTKEDLNEQGTDAGASGNGGGSSPALEGPSNEQNDSGMAS